MAGGFLPLGGPSTPRPGAGPPQRGVPMAPRATPEAPGPTGPTLCLPARRADWVEGHRARSSGLSLLGCKARCKLPGLNAQGEESHPAPPPLSALLPTAGPWPGVKKEK